jgi:hypothetical protein
VNIPNSDFASILERAAQSADRPTPAEMVAALETAEINARKSRLAIPFGDLVGEWRLCFATGAKKNKQGGIKLGKGYYLPKFAPASIAFTRDLDSSMGSATNRLLVAGVQLQFTGPCRYPGKKNLLIFDFTQIQFKLFGSTVYQGKFRSGKDDAVDFEELSIAKLPFFSFFWVGTNVIAARGRGGGMALWVRD